MKYTKTYLTPDNKVYFVLNSKYNSRTIKDGLRKNKFLVQNKTMV